MKISVLTNPDCEGFEEDELIASAFKHDSNEVTVNTVYDLCLDNNYDLIIRRNTWEENTDRIESFNNLGMEKGIYALFLTRA